MSCNSFFKKYAYLSLLFFLVWPAFVSIHAKSTNEVDRQLDSGEIVRLQIIGMADLHGNFLTYDHIRRRPSIGGLPHVYAYVKEQRLDTTQHVILMNVGDVLQGQMAVYFYNFLDTREEFMPSIFFNKVGVDVSVMGNHDLEPGSPVYGRFKRTSQELKSDILGANIVFRGTSVRYLRPYTILQRGGLRIAILGLLTPIHTNCVKTEVAEGISVLDMFEPARYWVNHIQTMEEPDLIIGLFHAGFVDTNRGYNTDVPDCYNLNDPMYIARNIPGFDAIFLGHFHRLLKDSVHVDGGHPIWLLESGNGGASLAVLNLEVEKRPGERARILSSSPEIVGTVGLEVTDEILTKLRIREEEELVAIAANRFVATLKDTIFNIEAYFGSSFYVDLVHKVKLEYTGAEVSFSSPLSSNIVIPAGELLYADMLRVYRFENKLTMFKMSGREIKDYLEYSYSLWFNQMHSPDDKFLRTRARSDNSPFITFEIPQYFFDSGAGLDYEVNVTKPVGERVNILRMWSDRPFHKDSIYSVVTTTYRFFGAGGHMELGAGITTDELPNRVIRFDHNQVRELIYQDFTKQGEVRAFQFNNWRFVPESHVGPARAREIKTYR